jgi:amino acid adenylation domain-containing protein
MSDVQIEGYYLSPQQKRVWLLCRDNGAAAFSAWLKVRIRGPFDLDAFTQAVHDAYRKHELLRTSLTGLDELEVPLQVAQESVDDPFQACDLSDLGAAAALEQIERIEAELQVPPSFSREALVRMRLVSVGSEEHLFWIAAPSLCTDAEGLDNLMAIVSGYYGQRLENEEPSDDPLQYPDASAWLNEVLDSEDTKVGREFWSRHDLVSLRDAKLPFEGLGHGAPFAPRRMRIEPPATLAATSAAIDISPAMVLMACWQWLLSRLVGDTRLLVSVSSPLRDFEELESALGLFARQLPLTGELPGSLTLREASLRLEGISAESEKWGLCFDRARLEPKVEEVRLDFAPYVFESTERPEPWRVGTTQFETEQRRAVTDRFKLKLTYERGADTHGAFLEFDAGIFRDDDVARSARELETLVADAVAHPERPLEELCSLPEAERLRLHGSEDDRGSGVVEKVCVHELIGSRAREFPDRQAVVSSDQESISYATLDRDSNRLASRLIDMGVHPDSTVAFCLGRAPESVVVMLAILKAGGAYVPVDPKLPKARKSRLLDDSGAGILVSREAFISDWSPSANTLLLDRDAADIESGSSLPVDTEVLPHNLAYVLFTSGSTGKPKGVAIEHRQLSNYIRAVLERLDVPAESRFAAVSTMGADLGNTSIFAALSSGGTLHLVPDDCVADPDAYSEYSTRHEIDVLKIVPTHLEMLLTSRNPSAVLPRRLLVLGGEACTWGLVERVRRIAPALAVINHYGPTETTVGVTTYRVPFDPVEPRSRTVPIGRALENVRAYVVDDRLALVPYWVAGELYIGGANVARGYLHATQAESEKFCVDPFSRAEGARMYRTGDIARLLPGGDLEFLGRADDQVKIRGYRVELQEIEAALRLHPAVIDAVVIVRDDGDEGKRLVGYVVRKDNDPVESRQLREFLGEELPEYMVPSSVVILDALPLNRNGKVDRSALPRLDTSTTSDARTVQELTTWEMVIRDIWRELLHTDDVTADDNFYDLGGHSLLAISAVSEIERSTGLHVSPRELVFHTLRQFAALCQSKQEEPGTVS